MMENNIKKAIFASGCFWGTQYYFDKLPGVISTQVGYSGGKVDNPTYEQVSTGGTGYVESVEVTYDAEKVTYEELTKYFFETHNPEQYGGQGPDIGDQYRSVIFYANKDEKMIADNLIDQLIHKGLDIATIVEPAGKFWPAEDYHQKYYENKGGTPYCHIYRKLF